MNDHSATSSATRDDHPELARRLEGLAQTTTLDVDAAWDTIQTRIATGRPAGGDRRFPPRLLLAAAVVAILLAAAALVTTRGDGDGRDGDRVQTADHSDEDDSPSRPRRARTSTTATGREAPSLPGAAGGQGSGGSSRPRGGGGSAAAPTGLGDGAPTPGGGASGPGSSTSLPPEPDPPMPPAIGPDTPLSRHGIGPITAGMTLRQAEQVAGVTIDVYEGDESSCTFAEITWPGDGVSFVADDVGGPAADPMDAVIRSVYKWNGRTEEGVAHGDPTSKLDEIYGPPTHTYPDWNGPGWELRIYASGGYAYSAVVNSASITSLESGDPAWVGVGDPNQCAWP